MRKRKSANRCDLRRAASPTRYERDGLHRPSRRCFEERVSGRVAIVRCDAGGNQIPLELLPSPGAELQEYVLLNERGDFAFVATDPEFGAPFVTVAGATATTRSMFIPHLGGIDSLVNIEGDEAVIQGDNTPTRPWQFRDGVLSPLASPTGKLGRSRVLVAVLGEARDLASRDHAKLTWSARARGGRGRTIEGCAGGSS